MEVIMYTDMDTDTDTLTLILALILRLTGSKTRIWTRGQISGLNDQGESKFAEEL